jgi:hypothetical protein
MGAEELPEEDPLALEIERLELQEQELSAERRLLHHRIDVFADELAFRRERELSARRRELHRHIDELRRLLRPIRKPQDE